MTRHSLLHQFLNLVKLMHKLEKKPQTYGTSERFSSREIHLIEMIGIAGGISVTKLAHQLEVTKGAVSQSLKRLEKRGLIQKDVDQNNLSRAHINLTAKGKIAYEAHRLWHETMDGGFLQYFESLDEQHIIFMKEFVAKANDFFANRVLQDK